MGNRIYSSISSSVSGVAYVDAAHDGGNSSADCARVVVPVLKLIQELQMWSISIVVVLNFYRIN